jgi:CheY-like chemotaxis protein
MILIAEDNLLMRKMICSLVEDLDGEILECGDGLEACRLYQRHRPNWVLMDISMQPMDGLTATRRIVKEFPAARIIIVTEHNDNPTRASALEAGASNFFGKDDLLPLRRLIGNQTV